MSLSRLAGRARYRRLKYACARATRCGSQTRAPERASVRRSTVRSSRGVPAQSGPLQQATLLRVADPRSTFRGLAVGGSIKMRPARGGSKIDV